MKTLNKSVFLVVLMALSLALPVFASPVIINSGGTVSASPCPANGPCSTPGPMTSTKFNLMVGQTFTSGYIQMAITLNSLKTATANVTVDSPGGCGPSIYNLNFTNDTRCLGAPAFNSQFDFNVGESKDVLGASLRFVQLVSNNEAVFILTIPRSEVSPTPKVSIRPTPTPKPKPTPPIIDRQVISVEQPARFTLVLNQTAKITNYKNLTITLINTDFLPCNDGPCILNLLPAKARATILVGSGVCLLLAPSRSGDTNPPECKKSYDISIDSPINVTGLSISLTDVGESNAGFYITTSPRPIPTQRPLPAITPPSVQVDTVTKIKQVEAGSFEINGKQKGRFLFLFPVEVNISYSIKNSVTTNVARPWWSVLVW